MIRLAALALATLPLAFSVYVFPLILVLWLHEQAASATLVSLNAALGGVSILVTTLILPGLLRRWRPWVWLALGTLLVAASMGVVALWPAITIILLTRLLYGFGFALAWGAGESWLNTNWPQHQIGRAMGAYMVAWYAPMPLAPLLLSHYTGQEVLVVWLLVGLLAGSTLLLWPLRHEKPLHAERIVLHWSSWQLAPLLVAVAFLAGGLESSRTYLFPLFLAQMGLPQAEVLRLVFWLACGGLAINLLAGWVADHVPSVRVLFTLASGGVLSALLFSFYFTSPLAIALVAVLGGCLNAVYPVTSAMIGRYLPKAQRLEINAAVLFFYTLGLLCLPPLIGLAMDWKGPEIFPLLLATLFILMLLAVWQQRRSFTSPAESGISGP